MLTILAGAMLNLSVSCPGQDAGTNHSQPHFAGQAPGESQEILRRIEGPITAVDSKAMTVTIKSTEGLRALKITPKTKITREGKPASMSDAAVGKTVEAVVKNGHAQPHEAITLNIKDK